MYKREEINGTTPLDIKKLNDNIRNLWAKVFGDIEMADMSYETKLNINSKVSSGDVSSIIQQSPEDIKIGFNGINNVINMDALGLQVNHTDGSFTRMEGGGFVRYVSGTGKKYKCLSVSKEFDYMQPSTAGLFPSVNNTYTINLPSEFAFINKNDVTVSLSISKLGVEVPGAYCEGAYTIVQSINTNQANPNIVVMTDAHYKYLDGTGDVPRRYCTLGFVYTVTA